MHPRRVLYLIVFLISTVMAVWAYHTDLGLLRPIVVMVAIPVAIITLLAAIFNPQVTRPDTEYDKPETPVDRAIGYFAIALFAAVPLFIAARGLHAGVLPALGSGADITLAESPAKFVMVLLMWVGGGVGNFPSV